MNELRIEVAGLPPAKNEARSLFGARNSCRARVVRLLEAARDAMAMSGIEPFGPGASLGLQLVVRCQRDGYARCDATNYLGGIGDVLQSRRVNADVAHLGELAEVYVYPDDKQIHEIHCKLLDAGKESYAVQLWQLPE